MGRPLRQPVNRHHREELIEGVQLHPEAILTEHGLDMLRNFYGRAQKKREGVIFDEKKSD